MTIPKEVRDVVVSAYYRRLMSSSDAARARAQAAYGIASAIAGAVVAAGFLGGLRHQAVGIQTIVAVALVAWLIAAGLFLHAVSSPFEMILESGIAESAFIGGALEAVRAERAKIDSWQRKARLASMVAALATAGAFLAALWSTDSPATRPATVTVTAAGSAALKAACGTVAPRLTGRVVESSLSARFMQMTLSPDMCGRQSVDVFLPSSDVLAVAFGAPPRP